jgi:NDP-sugar pyrophosphorylase family protein
MKAMILAAGFGTRLRPMTETLPKPLVPVNGRPLIEYTLILLRSHGVREVVINLHHQGEKIREALGTGSNWGVRIAYSEEPEILGTGGGIKKAEPLLSDGPFWVINGDILVDIDLRRVADFHAQRAADVTLVLREDPDADRWGPVEIDSRDRIRSICGRPPHREEMIRKRMFCGIHIVSPAVFAFLPDRGFSNIMDAYREMIAGGKSIAGYTMDGYWMDIGTEERYRLAQEHLREGTTRLSHLSEINRPGENRR